ncbi:hypothetical protein [Clostridium butyricum]|uniref:hypothetical protein n=1 Tax=Clostridium butyricum TaxID=1492 RepID=UPI0022E91D72|nr:hypothetical protein [Clostridium butyricum]
MNIKIYKELIQDLINQGIKVQDLTLLQISYSIKLYKMMSNKKSLNIEVIIC